MSNYKYWTLAVGLCLLAVYAQYSTVHSLAEQGYPWFIQAVGALVILAPFSIATDELSKIYRYTNSSDRIDNE